MLKLSFFCDNTSLQTLFKILNSGRKHIHLPRFFKDLLNKFGIFRTVDFFEFFDKICFTKIYYKICIMTECLISLSLNPVYNVPLCLRICYKIFFFLTFCLTAISHVLPLISLTYL